MTGEPAQTSGININADQVEITGDVIDRDKIITAGGDMIGQDKHVHGDGVAGDKVMGDYRAWPAECAARTNRADFKRIFSKCRGNPCLPVGRQAVARVWAGASPAPTPNY